MVGLTKQAAFLTEKQVKNALARTRDYRNALRNRTIVELTVYAGLRAKEVASLRWEHVLDEQGEIGDVLRLTNDASKGKSGGMVPLNSALRATLGELRAAAVRDGADPKSPVIVSERGNAMKRQSVVNLLREHYQRCDISGASSHSGRRTFITNVARKISVAGGSISDVQALARHANLQTTQRYIEHNTAAQRQVMNLI